MRNLARRGFTLIELLIVVAIIAVLVAMLLPALGKAKTVSLRLKSSANMRAMTQGFMMYAADRKGTLPSVAMSLGTDPVWFKELLGPVFDFTPIFKDYNLMPVTANPVLGTPRFDDPGNANVWELAMPWYYYAGVNSGTHECTVPGFETVKAIAPVRLERGQAKSVVMQDQLVNYNGVYGANLVNTGAPFYGTSPLSLNVTRGAIYVQSINDVHGVYTATYDGAVVLRSPKESRWAGMNIGITTVVFSHYQPD